MTDKAKVQKSIKLSFELMEFLVKNPSVAKSVKEEDLVIFTKDRRDLNKNSEKTVLKLKRSGKKVSKATRNLGKANKWSFQTA